MLKIPANPSTPISPRPRISSNNKSGKVVICSSTPQKKLRIVLLLTSLMITVASLQVRKNNHHPCTGPARLAASWQCRDFPGTNVSMKFKPVFFPWKFTWNTWRFGSDGFPDFKWMICRFQPLIFRGVNLKAQKWTPLPRWKPFETGGVRFYIIVTTIYHPRITCTNIQPTSYNCSYERFADLNSKPLPKLHPRICFLLRQWVPPLHVSQRHECPATSFFLSVLIEITKKNER